MSTGSNQYPAGTTVTPAKVVTLSGAKGEDKRDEKMDAVWLAIAQYCITSGDATEKAADAVQVALDALAVSAIPAIGGAQEDWKQCRACFEYDPEGNAWCPQCHTPAGTQEPPHGTCDVPPTGWWCSREKGHEGPCAARADSAPDEEEVFHLRSYGDVTAAELERLTTPSAIRDSRLLTEAEAYEHYNRQTGQYNLDELQIAVLRKNGLHIEGER